MGGVPLWPVGPCCCCCIKESIGFCCASSVCAEIAALNDRLAVLLWTTSGRPESTESSILHPINCRSRRGSVADAHGGHAHVVARHFAVQVADQVSRDTHARSSTPAQSALIGTALEPSAGFSSLTRALSRRMPFELSVPTRAAAPRCRRAGRRTSRRRT